MTTTSINRADVYSRPAARFDEDGNLEIRASAVGNCRRALWYAATECEPTNPPSAESLTVMEAGNALEPVVLRAMERNGWQVTPADSQNPQQVSVQLGYNLKVSGHPDATAKMHLDENEAVAEAQMFLFEDETPASAYGASMIVEVKTRGPEAFKRWRTLGAERSHPTSVAQTAFYTLGTFGEMRDAVIAAMDTGSRQWDYEVIPAERLERALEAASEWLGRLGAHYLLHGADLLALPDRDFSYGSWQCASCPFLAACLPGMREASEGAEADTTDTEDVSAQEARDAVAAYVDAQEALRGPERAKRKALDTLKAWMRDRGHGKTSVDGRTVSMVQSKRYSVDYRKLNALLDPETRAQIVTESVSEYVRVT